MASKAPFIEGKNVQPSQTGKFSLGMFGLAIGVLTALSSHAGTTSTLIGLLFAVIGGSFVGWYRKGELTAEQIERIIHHASTLCKWLLIGVCIGFVLRAADRALLEPFLISVEKTTPSVLEKQRTDVATAALDLQKEIIRRERESLDKLKEVSDANLTRFGTVLDLTSKQNQNASHTLETFLNQFIRASAGESNEKVPDKQGGTLVLQNATNDRLSALSKSLASIIEQTTDAKEKSELTRLNNWITEWSRLKQNSKDLLPLFLHALEVDDRAKSGFEESVVPILKSN